MYDKILSNVHQLSCSSDIKISGFRSQQVQKEGMEVKKQKRKKAIKIKEEEANEQQLDGKR